MAEPMKGKQSEASAMLAGDMSAWDDAGPAGRVARLRGSAAVAFEEMSAPVRALRKAVTAAARRVEAEAELPEAAGEATAAAGRARQSLSAVLQVGDAVAQRLEHVVTAEEIFAEPQREEAQEPSVTVARFVVARQLSGLAEDLLDRRDEATAALVAIADAAAALEEILPDEARAIASDCAAAEAVVVGPLATAAEDLAALGDARASAVEAGLAGIEVVPAALDWLKSIYTMQEERVLHERAFEDIEALNGAAPSVEADEAAAAETAKMSFGERIAAMIARLPPMETVAGFRLALGAVLTGTTIFVAALALGGGTPPGWFGLAVLAMAQALVGGGAGVLLYQQASGRLARLAEDFERLAFRDALTDLLNRRGLTDLMARKLSPDAGGQRLPVAVLHIDLDHFKAVNDTLGHDAGDHVLEVTAERMAKTLAEETSDAALCRIGGDEFCALIWGSAAERAIQAGEALVAVARIPIDWKGNTCQIGASIGVASGGGADGPHAPERLLTDADLATYVAKEEGRGRVAVFDASLRAERDAEARMTVALTRAMEAVGSDESGQSGGLSVWFQPAVALGSGGVMVAEALARWRDPDLGEVEPETFLAVAERHGLAERLSSRLLEAVGDAVAQWRAEGVELPIISINLGAMELRLRDIDQRVETVLERAGIPPEGLAVEVRERAATGRGAQLALEALARLRARGVHVIVDRFGRDEVSLSTITAMGASGVKLDRALVGQLGEDADGLALLRGLVSLAGSLSLPVIATGVETKAQLKPLEELGCTALQGFAVARPEPQASFAGWLSFADVLPPTKSGLGGGASAAGRAA
ncbi:MAG: EAL domain-containing protein [Pseudomonadota bacterium]